MAASSLVEALDGRLVKVASGATATFPDRARKALSYCYCAALDDITRIVALARKLAGILFAMWKVGRPYNPALAAEPMT